MKSISKHLLQCIFATTILLTSLACVAQVQELSREEWFVESLVKPISESTCTDPQMATCFDASETKCRELAQNTMFSCYEIEYENIPSTIKDPEVAGQIAEKIGSCFVGRFSEELLDYRKDPNDPNLTKQESVQIQNCFKDQVSDELQDYRLDAEDSAANENSSSSRVDTLETDIPAETIEPTNKLIEETSE